VTSAIIQTTVLLLLFLLLYVSIREAISSLASRQRKRSKLQHVREAKLDRRLNEWVRRSRKLFGHFTELLESVRSPLSVGSWLIFSAILTLSGILAGTFLFRSVKGIVVLSTILGTLPYLFLRIKLLGLQLKARLEFLPAVEVFYQFYVLSGQRNVRSALQGVIEERRIAYPMYPVFEQLYRNLTTNRDPERGLRIFDLSLGHLWARYFSGILKIALQEGNPVGTNLRELITDMRRAQRTDQNERNRLLEIRIANFTPILFLLLFVAINVKINPHSAYLHYVADEHGRNMLLDALVIIFGSFIMGIYLSMRRM
jgi:hypothetical protein